MPALHYKCPTTGLTVQTWSATDPAAYDDRTYENIICPICTRMHLVNPKSGKVMGQDDDE
jgi:hypothetical protein